MKKDIRVREVSLEVSGRGGPGNDRNGFNIVEAWPYHYNLFTPQLVRNSRYAFVLRRNRTLDYRKALDISKIYKLI